MGAEGDAEQLRPKVVRGGVGARLKRKSIETVVQF